MCTYSGGLGVLAGDTLKTFADFGFTAVGISLLAEKGYVEQEFDAKGKQISLPEPWNKEQYLSKLPFTIEIPFKDRTVTCAVWQYSINGKSGQKVPVYFLDTNLSENNDYDRTLTSHLYGGDSNYRLCQEYLLGAGGFSLLNKLGFSPEKVRIYHLNEGHAAFTALSLHAWAKKMRSSHKEIIKLVQSKVVFTTHTPVPAGHDIFSKSDVGKTLPPLQFRLLPEKAYDNGDLNMTRLSLYYAGTVTCVARTHEKVTEEMFPEYNVIPITNGVYHLQWTHPIFKKLYDDYIPSWRIDPYSLQKALTIPNNKVWEAHTQAKRELIEYVHETSTFKLSVNHFTLGFARRVTLYKRATLILSDIKKLQEITAKAGPLQIIFAGEAHPQDREAANLIAEIFQKAGQVKSGVTIAYLEDYNMDLALKLTAGVDVWLNTPQRPYEASGTSGMKAALNTVPHLSVLDGWWPEGWIEGITGWSIGSRLPTSYPEGESSQKYTVADLYNKLANKILPLYYNDRPGFIQMMKHAAALNGSLFNTYRMLKEYIAKVYFPK